MTKRAALILAGGKARRFQSRRAKWEDKALAELSGKPLLIRAIENVGGVVDEIVVSVSDEERKERYAQILKNNGLIDIEIVVDEKNLISGPVVAIMSALKSVQSDFCLTLPCDMPYLKPSVADYLFTQAEGFEVTVPMWSNGRLETLLMVLERRSGLEITETLCKLNRPRSDDIPRGASKVLFPSPMKHIKKLDPEFKSFININSKEDLGKPQTRHPHSSVTENMKLNLGAFPVSDLQLLREGAKMLQEGKFSEAQNTFSSCAANFEVAGSFFWAGVSRENQGEALLKLAQRQLASDAAAERDFEGKEAFLRAANSYRCESEVYEENRCWLLAERARADKAWCESWAMGKQSHVRRYPPKYGGAPT